MEAKPIDVELMQSLLEYAPEVGGSCLKWRVDVARTKIKAGMRAGNKDTHGYWVVTVNRSAFKAHRLVWAIVMKKDPQCHVDHIHGKEAGNRIENLRLAYNNEADNAQNRKISSNNSSGYAGVVWVRRRNSWQAVIQTNGIKKWLGYFDTAEKAHDAYLKAKAELHIFQPTLRKQNGR